MRYVNWTQQLSERGASSSRLWNSRNTCGAESLGRRRSGSDVTIDMLWIGRLIGQSNVLNVEQPLPLSLEIVGGRPGENWGDRVLDWTEGKHIEMEFRASLLSPHTVISQKLPHQVLQCRQPIHSHLRSVYMHNVFRTCLLFSLSLLPGR